jgi:hypothetical protein
VYGTGLGMTNVLKMALMIQSPSRERQSEGQMV